MSGVGELDISLVSVEKVDKSLGISMTTSRGAARGIESSGGCQ